MSRLPSTGPSLQRYLRQQARTALRMRNSSAFARSGTSVSAEGVVTVDGMLTSFDFDGTGPTSMGTTGWAFGSTNGGPSWFIINGHMIFDDLMAQDALIIAQQATLTAQVAAIAALVNAQILVGSAAAEFGMSSAIALSANPAAPTTLTTLSVTVPDGVTNAVATTSVVPAIYTASGTGSFTATVESTLTSGGSGAYSYAGEITEVVGAVTSACTVTKPIVLASVTPGATITMRATAYASGAGVLAEGDGSLSILFLR